MFKCMLDLIEMNQQKLESYWTVACIALLHNEDKIHTVSTFALTHLLQFLMKTQVI